MDISIQFRYFDEVMGPTMLYGEGEFKISEEDIYMLLSSIEPYSVTTESSVSGPSYKDDYITMVYNRSLCNLDAKDERLCLMGTDCWVIISCKKKNELVLLSKIDIVKMIIDIEFDALDEVNQITYDICSRTAHAINKLYE